MLDIALMSSCAAHMEKAAAQPKPKRRRAPDEPKPDYKDDANLDFTEDFKASKSMIFSAATLQPWINTVVSMLFPALKDTGEIKLDDGSGDRSLDMTLRMREFDPWVHEHRDYGFFCPVPLGPKRWTRNWQHCGRGRSWTTDRPIKLPILTSRDEVWMSLAPMEIMTLRHHHKRCTGNVLIGGLGLGYSALRVLQREQVKHVTVIEKSKPLINEIGRNLQRQFGDRVEFICDDVWQYLKVDSRTLTANIYDFDSLFIDVWPGYGYNKSDHRFEIVAAAAKAAGKKAMAWG